MDRRRERGRRVARAIDVRRGLDAEKRRRGGRAWLNGRPLGSSERLGYLAAIHD